MKNKNNLPSARGFGQSNPKPADDNNLKKCLNCGLLLADDMPRGLVLEGSKVTGVQCISCCEADQTTIKYGSPKNPVKPVDWES